MPHPTIVCYFLLDYDTDAMIRRSSISPVYTEASPGHEVASEYVILQPTLYLTQDTNLVRAQGMLCLPPPREISQ